MADQSFQQAMSVIRVTIQASNIIATTVTQVLDTLLKENRNPLEEEMRKAYTEGKALGIEMSGEDAEQLRRIMAEKGFGRDPQHPMQTCLVDVEGTAKTMFFVLKKDKDLATECLEELNKEKNLGGVISPQDMVRYASKETFSIEMPPECAIAMAKRAEQYGLKFAVDGPAMKNGEQKMKMFFATKDKQLFNRVQMETMCDLSGNGGAIYRSMIEKESLYQAQAMSAMITGRTPNMENIRNGTMLVNDKGTTLEVTGGNLVLLQADGTKNVFRRADMNKDITRIKIQQHFSYGEISLLSPEQAENYKQAGSMESKSRVMMEGRLHPTGGLEPIVILSPQQIDMLKQHEAERELIAQKLQEEQPGFAYMTPQLYDNSPFIAFSESQNRNAEVAQAMGVVMRTPNEMIIADNAYIQNIIDAFTEPKIDEVDPKTFNRVFNPELEQDEVEVDVEYDRTRFGRRSEEQYSGPYGQGDDSFRDMDVQMAADAFDPTLQ